MCAIHPFRFFTPAALAAGLLVGLLLPDRVSAQQGTFGKRYAVLVGVNEYQHNSQLDQAVAYAARPRRDYFRRPGVWEDLKAVYEPYLKMFPRAASDRSRYARLACWCGQRQEAHRQFQLLGRDVVLSVFESREEYEALRKEAADAASR